MQEAQTEVISAGLVLEQIKNYFSKSRINVQYLILFVYKYYILYYIVQWFDRELQVIYFFRRL